MLHMLWYTGIHDKSLWLYVQAVHPGVYIILCASTHTTHKIDGAENDHQREHLNSASIIWTALLLLPDPTCKTSHEQQSSKCTPVNNNSSHYRHAHPALVCVQ